MLHLLLGKALQCIVGTSLDAAETGKVAVAEVLTAIFREVLGKMQEASVAKFEWHNAHIRLTILHKQCRKYWLKMAGNLLAGQWRLQPRNGCAVFL